MFGHEIESWEKPELRLSIASEPVAIHQPVSSWIADQTDGKTINSIFVNAPKAHAPYYSADLYYSEDGKNGHARTAWDTQTGGQIETKGKGISKWIIGFHHHLMWPSQLGGAQIGRLLTGIIGIALLLSIVSGIVAHTKIIQEFYTLRLWRSVRLRWQDTHKVLGLWSLPFSAMIAFTGAFIGIIAIMLPIVAMSMFKGDMQTMMQEMEFVPQQAAGIEAEMLDLDQVFDMQHERTGYHPFAVRIANWGDENAVYQLRFPSDQLRNHEAILINGATGERLPPDPFERPTSTNRVMAAVSALHFGTFGGLPLKYLYFGLGVILTVIIALGNMMWIERRLHGREGNKSEHFYRALSRLTIGISLGFPLATVAIFHADKLLFIGTGDYLAQTGQVYFAGVAMALLYAFARRDDYRATAELFAITGLLSLLIPVTNYIATGDIFLLSLGAPTGDYAVVDLTAVIFGAILLLCAWKLPQRRPEKKQPIQEGQSELMPAE